MPQPEAGPAVPAVVAARAKVDANDVATTVAAVNAWVRRLPVADLDATDWPADVVEGATMLAHRLVRRRNTPGGVETFGGGDAVMYVRRNDPDVAMLLQLGDYAYPSVG